MTDAPIDLAELRQELRHTAPGVRWADGIPCKHNRRTADCEWCNPKNMETLMQETRTVTDRDRVAAVLRSVADAVHLVQVPTPTSVTIWSHRLSSVEILDYADRHGVPIEYRRRNDGGRDVAPTDADYVVVKVVVGADILPSDRYVEINLDCDDVSPEALAGYARHNELVAPCTPDTCPDPEAHAEGAHDL